MNVFIYQGAVGWYYEIPDLFHGPRYAANEEQAKDFAAEDCAKGGQAHHWRVENRQPANLLPGFQSKFYVWNGHLLQLHTDQVTSLQKLSKLGSHLGRLLRSKWPKRAKLPETK